jgi:hypothetical protein
MMGRPEIDEERGGGAHVEEHHKRQERWVALVDGPVKQAGKDDRVTEAADGEELGDALEQRQHQGLESRHFPI